MLAEILQHDPDRLVAAAGKFADQPLGAIRGPLFVAHIDDRAFSGETGVRSPPPMPLLPPVTTAILCFRLSVSTLCSLGRQLVETDASRHCPRKRAIQ